MNNETTKEVINDACQVLQIGRKRNQCVYQSDVTLQENEYKIIHATFEIYDDGEDRTAFLETTTGRIDITSIIDNEVLADMTHE